VRKEKQRDKWINALNLQIKGFQTEKLQWVSTPLVIPKTVCFISGRPHSIFSPLISCQGCGNSFDSEYCPYTYEYPHIGKPLPACVYCFDDFSVAEQWKKWLDPILEDYNQYENRLNLVPFVYHQFVQRERVEMQKKKKKRNTKPNKPI